MVKSKTYQWKNPTTLGRIVMTMMAFIILRNLASLIFTFVVGEAANYSDDDVVFTPVQFISAAFDTSYLLILGFGLFSLGWIWRVSANAHATKKRMSTSVPGAVFWYFVPLVSLIKPYEAMSEIWRVSSPETFRQDENFLRLWWGFFLAASTSLNFLNRFSSPAFEMISDALGIAAAAAFFLLVRRLSTLQVDQQTLGHFGPDSEAKLSIVEQMAEGY